MTFIGVCIILLTADTEEDIFYLLEVSKLVVNATYSYKMYDILVIGLFKKKKKKKQQDPVFLLSVKMNGFMSMLCYIG